MGAQSLWHGAAVRRRWAVLVYAPLLAWLAVGVFNPATMGAEDPDEPANGVIAVELNRADPVPNGCRLSFVIRNRTPHAFASLQWDLVFFDRDDLIAGRTAAEAAPLPKGKTSMKQYDIPGLACERLRRVLLNDVMRCDTAGGGNVPLDCLRLMVLSSRAGIQFFK
jgi:hypothetical protein